jgi:dihydroorotate dehydrogenase
MSDKLLYALARPLLFSLDPETAHNLTLPALRRAAALGLTGLRSKPAPDPRTVMGITFPNPVGLAAGLDKDGAYIDGLAALGFGSIEIGTVTPRPQAGNPKPRMFRLPAARGIINRMGFNNGGVDAFVANVQASRFYQEKRGVLGLNIGKNADTPIERAADDYLHCLRKVYPYASYVTVNISSPNTKNLRQLQGASELDALLAQLKGEQSRLADQHGRYVPLALKIAPDIDADQIRDIAAALLRHKIDGVIATNTTLSRRDVEGHAPWRGNRRPVRRAGVRPVEHRDPRAEEGSRRRAADHRRGRHPERARREGQDRGRRPAGAAVQRPDLPRAGAGARMRGGAAQLTSRRPGSPG